MAIKRAITLLKLMQDESDGGGGLLVEHVSSDAAAPQIFRLRFEPVGPDAEATSAFDLMEALRASVAEGKRKAESGREESSGREDE